MADPSRCRTPPIPAAARRVRRSDRSTAGSASPAHAVRAKTRKTKPLVGLAAPPSLHFTPAPRTGVNQRPRKRATLSFSNAIGQNRKQQISNRASAQRRPDGTRGTYKDLAGACFQIDRPENWKAEGPKPCGLSVLLHDPDEAANSVSVNCDS